MTASDGLGIGFVDAKDFLRRRRDREQNDIVLILTRRRLAFRCQHTGDGERDVFDDDDLTGRVAVAEEVLRDGFAQYRESWPRHRRPGP